MKRPNMLSATFVKTVKTVKTPGRYGDGRGGLARLPQLGPIFN